ncbi:response regulator [Chloroflexota bacterium]
MILAHNRIEALEKVREIPPDVKQLNIRGSKMDGFEVARHFRGGKIIPIVMVTASTDVEDRVKALEVGADDFLAKLVNETELRAR